MSNSTDYQTQHDDYLAQYEAAEAEFRATCKQISDQFATQFRLYPDGHHFVNYLFGGTTIWCVQEAEATPIYDRSKQRLIIHYRCVAVHGMGKGQSYAFDTCADKAPDITKEYLRLKETGIV